MTYRSKVLLLCPAAIAGVAALLYAVTWQRHSTELLGSHTPSSTRRLNDIYRYVAPVTKGSSKHGS